MTMLINGRGDEGYALNDDEIRDQIISLITAGYETTSAAMAWAAYTLLTLPGRLGRRRRRGESGPRRPPAGRLRPRRAHLSQRRRPGNAAAVLARGDLRPQGDARPPVCRAPHPGGTVADIQRLRHPPAARIMAGPNRIPPKALGSQPAGLPQARAARIHPVQRRVASVHRCCDGHHRADGDVGQANRQDQAPGCPPSVSARQTSPRCPRGPV